MCGVLPKSELGPQWRWDLCMLLMNCSKTDSLVSYIYSASMRARLLLVTVFGILQKPNWQLKWFQFRHFPKDSSMIHQCKTRQGVRVIKKPIQQENTRNIYRLDGWQGFTEVLGLMHTNMPSQLFIVWGGANHGCHLIQNVQIPKIQLKEKLSTLTHSFSSI